MTCRTAYEKIVNIIELSINSGNETVVITHHVLTRYIQEETFNEVVKEHYKIADINDLINTSLNNLIMNILNTELEMFGIDSDWAVNQINTDMLNGTLTVDRSLFGRTDSYNINKDMSKTLWFGSVISYLLTYLPEHIDAPQEHINMVTDAIKELSLYEGSFDGVREENINLFLSSKNYQHYSFQRFIKSLPTIYHNPNGSSILKRLNSYDKFNFAFHEIENSSVPLGDDNVYINDHDYTTIVYIKEKAYNRLYLTNDNGFADIITYCNQHFLIRNQVVDNDYRQIAVLNKTIENMPNVDKLIGILGSVYV